MMTLSPELAKIRDGIREHAVAAGLDFFEVIFEVLDWKQMNAVAAYGGFPNRYPHWRFGMEYEQISKSYAYGLSKIYEMVINNDPSYAYLLHSNMLVDQKLVMAHVYGHSDFFKNNVYFANTNRKMIDEMGNHRTKIMRLMNKFGVDDIEEFIDCCLSLENLIDQRKVGFSNQKEDETHPDYIENHKNDDHGLMQAQGDDRPVVRKLKNTRDYMDQFVNPQSFLDSEKKKLEEAAQKSKKFPEFAERDVLLFLIEYAPLEAWEREVLSIIRDEAYYFAPQGQTKIMNEGWAAYHHTQMMTQKILDDSEIIDYADHHSGTTAQSSGRLNPYKLGMELFRYIEERWNKGKFGFDYERCDNMVEKKNWDKKLGLGREKIFEVRKLYNDVTFLDAYLTEEFCEDNKMFTYGYNPTTKKYEIVSRDFAKIKSKLLQNLSNFGQPIIHVIDGNAFNRGELTLKHAHDGVDLKVDWMWETLKNIHRVWKRPVHMETIVDEVSKVYTYDGKEKKEDRTAATA